MHLEVGPTRGHAHITKRADTEKERHAGSSRMVRQQLCLHFFFGAKCRCIFFSGGIIFFEGEIMRVEVK